jgi:hypothetical protein
MKNFFQRRLQTFMDSRGKMMKVIITHIVLVVLLIAPFAGCARTTSGLTGETGRKSTSNRVDVDQEDFSGFSATDPSSGDQSAKAPDVQEQILLLRLEIRQAQEEIRRLRTEVEELRNKLHPHLELLPHAERN